MHTVELYESAKQFADALGYNVREENLGGIGGGACEVAGRKCLFVDNAMSAVEQLDQVLTALSVDPLIHTMTVPAELTGVWPERRAAA